MKDSKKRLMWTLKDWGMLLNHHLTEATSKTCMTYMGRSVQRLEKKEMNEVKEFKISETNEAELKDWTPFHDKDLEKRRKDEKIENHGKCAVYNKIKGKEYKVIITLSDAKYEILVKINDSAKALLYNWELAVLMDMVIPTFIEGRGRVKRHNRLKKMMELLSTLDERGVQAIRKAWASEDAFKAIIKNVWVGKKSPFIAKKNQRSNLNRCIFFWRKDNGGEEAVELEKTEMIAAIRAIAMGLTAYPLHEAVEVNDLDSVVLLLANDIDPNAKDANGKRPLFDALEYIGASKNGKNIGVDIVKALLLFGADPKKEIKKGIFFESHLKSQMGYEENTSIKKDLQDIANMVDDNFLHKQVNMDHLEKSRYAKALKNMETALNEGSEIHNLLSLDGGGIRGLVLIEIMDALEKKYGPALLDRFKWVAGTSTGAIMAAALGNGKTVAECRTLYFRLKDLVFFRTTKLNPYPVKPLENFLKREFNEENEERQMKSLDNGAAEDPQKRKKNVMITTADCSETTAKLKFFRNYRVPEQSDAEHKHEMEFPVWEAARSSSAAPTYFPPVTRKYIDGGLIANNPVLPLIRDFVVTQEALDLAETPTSAAPARLGVVVSLGTGWKPVAEAKALKMPELGVTGCQGCAVNLFGLPGYISDAITAGGQLLKGIKDQILRSESSVQNAHDWAFSMNGAFFRFNPSLEGKIALDETDNTVLIEMLWMTRKYMRSQHEYVDMFVELLKRTTEESDGKRSYMSQSTMSIQPEEKVMVPEQEVPEYYVSYYLRPDEMIDLSTIKSDAQLSELLNDVYIKSAMKELREDPRVRARSRFLEDDKLPLAISPENENYLKLARTELEQDRNVRARIRFLEDDKLPLAISPENEDYLKAGRLELEEDPNVSSRVQFLANDRLPLAIELEEEVADYPREDLDQDPHVRIRAQFLANDKLPLAIETEEVRSPSFLDIPDIDVDEQEEDGAPKPLGLI